MSIIQSSTLLLDSGIKGTSICFAIALGAEHLMQIINLPLWPSWLDSGALINVDAPGCGTLVVQGHSAASK